MHKENVITIKRNVTNRSKYHAPRGMSYIVGKIKKKINWHKYKIWIEVLHLPPLIQTSWSSIIPISFLCLWKTIALWGFVRISAFCSSDLQYSSYSPSCLLVLLYTDTWCQYISPSMQNRSFSNDNVDLSSQKILVASACLKLISSSNFFNQIAWVEALAADMYSASVEDNAITCFFSKDKENNPDPSQKTKPAVLLLSSTSHL